MRALQNCARRDLRHNILKRVRHRRRSRAAAARVTSSAGEHVSTTGKVKVATESLCGWGNHSMSVVRREGSGENEGDHQERRAIVTSQPNF